MVIPKGKFKTECKQYLSQTSDSFTCTAYTLLSEQGQNHITPNLSEAYFLCSQLTDTCLFLPNFSPNITVLLYCPFSVLGQRDFWASLFYNPRGLKWKVFLLTEVKDSQFPNVAHNTCLERTQDIRLQSTLFMEKLIEVNLSDLRYEAVLQAEGLKNVYQWFF